MQTQRWILQNLNAECSFSIFGRKTDPVRGIQNRKRLIELNVMKKIDFNTVDLNPILVTIETSYWVEDSLNLNILLSEGNEKNIDFFSSGERTRKSPRFEIGTFLEMYWIVVLWSQISILIERVKWFRLNNLL